MKVQTDGPDAVKCSDSFILGYKGRDKRDWEEERDRKSQQVALYIW